MINQEETTAAAFSYYPRLKKVKEYVDQHLEDKISLAMAAQIAGLEEKYFSAYFRKKTGVCFTRWIAHARVHRALDLLIVHDYTITWIAFNVGFQDIRTFERTFKRCTGMTAYAFKNLVQPREPNTCSTKARKMTAETLPLPML